MTEECIFCKIAAKKAPAFIVDENEQYMAFLSIEPNTDGMTVVIPKEHFSSDVLDMPDKKLGEFFAYCKKIAKILSNTFEDVGRTGLVLEGFAINHAHAKLFPLHGTKQKEFKPIISKAPVFFEKYEGFVTSNRGPRADPAQLEKVWKKIKGKK